MQCPPKMRKKLKSAHAAEVKTGDSPLMLAPIPIPILFIQRRAPRRMDSLPSITCE